MKKYFFIAAVAFAALSSVKAEDLSFIGVDNISLIEHASVVPSSEIVEQALLENDLIKSDPNSEGSVIVCLYRKDISNEALALRTKEGKMIYFYQHGIKTMPLVPPVTEKILWLNEDTFACVCSGRRNSFYAIYHIEWEDKDNTDNTIWAYTEAGGVLHFPVKWEINKEKLEGYLNGRPYISIGGE